MNKILGFLQKLFLFIKKPKEELLPKDNENSIKIDNINWNLINELMENDIVLVTMDKGEIQRQNIEECHQKRPFMIKEKIADEQSLCGYYLTGNINNTFFEKEVNKGLKLVLYKDFYQLSKNSIVILNNEVKLPYENIISIIDHINDEDLVKLKKYRNLLCHISVISNKENRLIEIGDIIFYDDKQYVIYQIDNTNCYGYPILQIEKNVDLIQNHNYIKFDSKIYFIDYKDNKVFNNNEKLCIIERWNYDIVEKIRHNKKLIKLEQKNNKVLKHNCNNKRTKK